MSPQSGGSADWTSSFGSTGSRRHLNNNVNNCSSSSSNARPKSDINEERVECPFNLKKRKRKHINEKNTRRIPVSTVLINSKFLLQLIIFLILFAISICQTQQQQRQQQLPLFNENNQLKLSHHIICEPISQLNDLKLTCPLDNQFIVILEAYYSDLYPEIVCPKAAGEAKLQRLTGSQLVNIFRQLYSPNSPASIEQIKQQHTSKQPPVVGATDSKTININSTIVTISKDLSLKFNPTLNYGSQRPFCLDDLKQSFQAKCSGRQRCRFNRHLDHQFPHCASLKPGHAFARYLCIDDRLLVRYCNADAHLASHTTALNRVKRQVLSQPTQQGDGGQTIDTPDFGFVASPGYPNFYATPTGPENSAGQPADLSCGWTIEAEVGQRVTVKLLDASLAPHNAENKNRMDEEDYTTSSSLFPSFDDHSRPKVVASSVSDSSGNLISSVPLFGGQEATRNRQQQQHQQQATGVPGEGDAHLITSGGVTSGLNSDPPAASGGEKVQFQLQQQQAEAQSRSNVHFERAASYEGFDPTSGAGGDNNLASDLTSSPAGRAYGTNNYINLLASIREDRSRRVVFKIDSYDYEILRLNLARKLQQVAAQCHGYDQLILRDTQLIQSNLLLNSTQEQNHQNNVTSFSELDLISKLPITLYKNHLIDFSNSTIYHKTITSGDDINSNLLSQQHQPQQVDSKRIDYQALISSLNPLYLAWFYQQNVSLCSNGQQDLLSSPIEKNKISFTSSGNRIRLELVSGNRFNPTNRGVLFWYHKHGCPATRRLPARVKLAFRNETIEIFQCFPGFVFADTRQISRVRYCDQQDQMWHDISTVTGQQLYSSSQDPEGREDLGQLPPCVYEEDLANSLSAEQAARFDRLVLPSIDGQSGKLINQPPGRHSSPRPLWVTSSSGDGSEAVAVEVVGLPIQPSGGSGSNGLPPHLLNNEVDLLDGDLLNGGNKNNELGGGSRLDRVTQGEQNIKSASFWQEMLDYLNLTGANRYLNGGQVRANEADGGVPRSIISHEPLGERQRITEKTNENFANFWQKSLALFDRRLLAPLLAVLIVFILINLIIYVIFIVALPKFASLLCGGGGGGSRRRRRQDRQRQTKGCYNNDLHSKRSSVAKLNGSAQYYSGTGSRSNMIYADHNGASSTLISTNGRSHNNKLSHYESDYSVSMGMSL